MDELIPKTKKPDPVGLRIFGDTFKHYMRIAEYVDLIPAFKDFYYQAKIKDPNENLTDICRNFHKEVCDPVGRLFHPSMSQMRVWRKKWDLDLMQQMTNKDLVVVERKNIHQIIKTRNDDRALVLGQADDNQLEAGVRTLGGELLNDAMQMLRDDQELEEIYDDETLIKRRNYIVNVFAHATRLVHGKAALMLKASEEKRNTAGFLMSLLSRATAGKMSDEEMGLLKSAYAPKQNEPAQSQQV
ncbi:MAG: hypothetical protein UW02_C0002G0038 [Candidatus Nomurabacteria bacterium GW2011_GWB1_43_7]|uniref:Uncharacterized protein n=2 Tax=Parcubacteria group TaxID=1794811 RepID=A0A0G1M9R4_9BACT|nr:MAG: hypothetical protein UW02_C0002G0038 [Candidatus Nomurabacteria bacterium GW2011_GWB1_43_7]KKU05054.1 MAG: hypothetical protein UX06_C0004G0022 [Candidatus Giovannonibacteria bacterium GW2011_GWA2_45_21]